MTKNHPKIAKNTGVLLINLGTPDGCDYFSVKKYLKQFLSDRRVIEVNPILWKLILTFFILPFRSKKTAANYQKVWMKEVNESPLRFYTKSQAEKLQALTTQNGEDFIVDYAMRYGNPSIESKIHALMKKGCDKIIFIPLYPQYCSATTASVCDEIYRVLGTIRYQPKIRISDPYHDNEIYIKALVSSTKTHLKTLDWKADAILSTYHGIPQEYFSKGDPYPCFCQKTNRLFSEELAKQEVNIPNHMSYQSRFGPKQWVKPYTEDVIKDLIKNGVKNLAVISPSFSSDCIETLEEIDEEYRELFIKNGGEKFSLIPCLNDGEDSIHLIHHLLKTANS